MTARKPSTSAAKPAARKTTKAKPAAGRKPRSDAGKGHASAARAAAKATPTKAPRRPSGRAGPA